MYQLPARLLGLLLQRLRHSEKERKVRHRAGNMDACERQTAAVWRPASLYLLGVVLGDVLVQGAHEDHGDHAGEEEDDEHRVDDGEPVDLDVGVGDLVVQVPACAPRLVGPLPLDVVSEDDFATLVDALAGHVPRHTLRIVARLQLGVRAPHTFVLVFDAAGAARTYTVSRHCNLGTRRTHTRTRT